MKEEITLTVREIIDLAKFVGIVKNDHEADIEPDDFDTEYRIWSDTDGTPIGDEDGNNPKLYPSAACLNEYPEEGSYPLGQPLP